MIISGARSVPANSVQYKLAAVARIANGPTVSQEQAPSRRRGTPTISTGEVVSRTCRSLFPWLCFLVVVAAFASALDVATEAIPTSPASATLALDTGSARESQNAKEQGSMRPGVLPMDASDASIGNALLRECDLGARVPNDVLVEMTMEELIYLEDTLCPVDPNGSTN